MSAKKAWRVATGGDEVTVQATDSHDALKQAMPSFTTIGFLVEAHEEGEEEVYFAGPTALYIAGLITEEQREEFAAGILGDLLL